MKSLGTWLDRLRAGKQGQTADLKKPDHAWINEPSAKICIAKPLSV